MRIYTSLRFIVQDQKLKLLEKKVRQELLPQKPVSIRVKRN